jgi:outer membrane murein-binding lipoprotein Lpp
MPQENNMAEVLRLLKTVIVKVDDLSTDMKRVKSDMQVLKSDMQVLKSDVQVLKGDVRKLDSKVNHLTGRFEDVASVVIEDTQTIKGLGRRVDPRR